MAPTTIMGDSNDACCCGTGDISRKQREVDEIVTSGNACNLEKDKERNRIFKLIHTFSQSKRRLLILGWAGILCIISSYGTFMLGPVARIIESELLFVEGSRAYIFWKEPPVKMYIKAHIFNVSNPEEFMAGKEKLRVEEVGPFIYTENLEFTNISFHDNGTLSYIPKRQLKKAPEMLGLDPDTVRVIVPNVVLLGITSYMHDYPFLTNAALTSLLYALETKPFLNLTATEFLTGYDDPVVQLAGMFIPSWIPFKTFGLLERMFAEGDNVVTMTVKPDVVEPMGSEDDADYNGQYLIDNFNGATEIPQLTTNCPNRKKPNRCTFVQGTTEGHRFKMNSNPNVTYWLYRKAFCRSLPIQYKQSVVSKRGYNAFQYEFREGMFDSPRVEPSNFCNVKEGSTFFMPSGLFSLSSCYYQIPVAASFPHFYKGDPSLAEAVDGMNPDASKHDTNILIQPDLGVGLEASVKMQMNVYVFETMYNAKVQPFNNMAVPLFWIEWCFDDLGPVYRLMNLALYIGPMLEFCAVVALCLSGLALVSFAVLGRLVSLRMDEDSGEGATVTRLRTFKQDRSQLS